MAETNHRPWKSLVGVLVLGCCIGGLGAYYWNTHGHLPGLGNATLVSEKEFTKKPPMKDMGDKIYKTSAESYTRDLGVTVEGIQFKKEYSKVFLTVKNDGAKELQILSGVNQATLTDNAGQQYKCEPLETRNPASIMPGTTAKLELAFTPIPTEVTTLQLTLPRLFRMGEAPFDSTVKIPFG